MQITWSNKMLKSSWAVSLMIVDDYFIDPKGSYVDAYR